MIFKKRINQWRETGLIPRLILIHAFPLDGRMWDEQLQILPGHTEAPTCYPLGESLEEWASGLLDMIDASRLIVVGCSMGGSCALEMARQAPDRIKALALVGAKAGHAPDPDYRDACIALLESNGPNALWPEIMRDLVGLQASSSVDDRIRALMLEQGTEDLIRAVKVFHSRPDLSDVVSQWEKPLVAICGDRDLVVTRTKTSALAASAPFGQMYVMRGCAHYMNMERPDEFNNIIGELVRSVEGDV